MAYKQGNFDEFESGTYTPVLSSQGSLPTVTYTTQLGKYTRTGNLVHVTVYIILDTFSGGTGAVTLSLPFNSANDSIGSQSQILTQGMAFNATTTMNVLRVLPNSGVAVINTNRDNGVTNTIGTARFAGGDIVNFTATYWI